MYIRKIYLEVIKILGESKENFILVLHAFIACFKFILSQQDGNFEQKERKFVANLINERVQNSLLSGFHDMRKALEEHEYVKESDLYINQYYLRQKTNFYYQHLVETAHLPLWPSIPVRILE